VENEREVGVKAIVGGTYRRFVAIH